MGNAHANRHGHKPDCIFCKMRPKEARKTGAYRNACQGSRARKGCVSGLKKKKGKGKADGSKTS